MIQEGVASPFITFGDLPQLIQSLVAGNLRENRARKAMFKKYLGILFVLVLVAAGRLGRDSDFVSLASVDPSIILEMRYYGAHNFLGRPVRGYGAPQCLLTKEAAKALSAVQAEAKKRGLSLKVYDCYRPQRAVDDFVAWAKDLSDIKMKKEFYPHVPKTELFKEGYIAAKSGHSRGSTVDLTLVRKFHNKNLDMGTGFDFFDIRAHTDNPEIGARQRSNRLLLKSLMEKQGFKNLPEEWWHYTLNPEPFPKRYFDFEIK